MEEGVRSQGTLGMQIWKWKRQEGDYSQTLWKASGSGKSWISAQENPFHIARPQNGEDSGTENLLLLATKLVTL